MTVKVIRSRRKTISLQVINSGEVLVRAPVFTSNFVIRSFVESKSAWIEKQQKHIALQEQKLINAEPLSEIERQELLMQARLYFQEKTAYYARLVGVRYGRISIRHQKSKWGSCSSKGNLNYNALLMLAPESVRDYVIVHELCHRIHMNHSPRFWEEVQRVLPDYSHAKRWLKSHGKELLLRNW